MLGTLRDNVQQPFIVDISHEEMVLTSRSGFLETWEGRGPLRMVVPETVSVPDGEYEFWGGLDIHSTFRVRVAGSLTDIQTISIEPIVRPQRFTRAANLP